MAKDDHINHLLWKYLNDRYNKAEFQELLDYFRIDGNEADTEQLLYEAIRSFETSAEVSYDRKKEVMDNAKRKLQQRINKRPATQIQKVLPYAAAILILLSISIGIYLVQNAEPYPTPQLTSIYGDDILPGSNRAMITLADGSRYELSEAAEGVQINEGGIQYEDGSMVASNLDIIDATISTPNGGQYRITLPDGTKVILNAATSLTYPSRFISDERLVTLEGEAYFDVVHQTTRPFRVKSKDQQIEVLGTKFNASTYATKSITTLIQGSVKLQSNNGENVLLRSGQQSVLEKDKFQIQTVSTEDYTSWIHNQFVFNDIPLEEVFAHLERWYDVAFDHPQELVDQRIYAGIRRDRNLSEVLKTLEEVVDLQFKIEGRRVLVRR